MGSACPAGPFFVPFSQFWLLNIGGIVENDKKH